MIGLLQSLESRLTIIAKIEFCIFTNAFRLHTIGNRVISTKYSRLIRIKELAKFGEKLKILQLPLYGYM